MKKNNGFTLIEVLVAIAIIGTLSSVTMVSLNSSKEKTKDKAVLTQLSNIKMQAEIYYQLNQNSYDGLCNAPLSNRGLGGVEGPGLLKDTQKNTAIISSIMTEREDGRYNQITCYDSDNRWVVEAPNSKSTESNPLMYCVDSQNMVKEKNSNIVGRGETQC